jgi:hypothetical protein
MPKTTKRENFEVTPEQQAEIEALQALIEAPTKKDAVLMAVHVALHLASETKKGKQLFLGQPGERDLQRLVMLGIEKPAAPRWFYLVEQAHPWKRQLFIKGRKLPAAAVWTGMLANKLSPAEAAENWELPLDAIAEIIEYCEANKALLETEAAEELRRLEEKGLNVVSKVARR